MRLELAAGAGDGRRARDGAGLRRGLGAAPGLNLGVTGHASRVRRVRRAPRANVKRRFEIYSHGLRRRRLKPADASLFINARARNDKAEISSVWCW